MQPVFPWMTLLIDDWIVPGGVYYVGSVAKQDRPPAFPVQFLFPGSMSTFVYQASYSSVQTKLRSQPVQLWNFLFMTACVWLSLIIDTLKAEMQQPQLQQKGTCGDPTSPSCCICPDLAQGGPNCSCKLTLAVKGKIKGSFGRQFAKGHSSGGIAPLPAKCSHPGAD